MTQATIEDFLTLDIRAGTITKVADFPKPAKAGLEAGGDFGPRLGSASSAQITDLYQPEDLIGRQILAVVNFPPRQIGPFISEVLTLGVSDADGAALCWLAARGRCRMVASCINKQKRAASLDRQSQTHPQPAQRRVFQIQIAAMAKDNIIGNGRSRTSAGF